MKSSQDSEKKEQSKENEQGELKQQEKPPAPIDSSALEDKTSPTGTMPADIEAEKLATAKKLEESNKKDASLGTAPIEIKECESATVSDNRPLTPRRQDVGDRLEEETRSKQAQELFAGKGTFFTRNLSERERLIAVRDSYDRIAQILPKQQAAPVKSEGRELLGLNASMEMAESIGRLTRNDSSESQAAKR
ncbi:MAG TPA: hypothetical protein PKA48_08195, partial [Candidatus Obscuribacter sp.]|nr:hypothetical protein [Candidatus Obscuribacter sp.]